MDAPTYATVIDAKSLPVKSALDELAQIEIGNERTKSSLAQLTSSSIEKLDELISEIQEMREFLKSEGERVQREIGNYAELSQSVALALTKIKADTICPWKGTDGEARQSGPKQLAGGRGKLKRWPAPPG
jgi:hypothetical protein